MANPWAVVSEVTEATRPSFEAFFEAEYGRLVRGLVVLTGSRTEGEDLAQEAMARVFERWERVRSMDSPAGYAYRTALNLNRKRLRRLRVAAHHVLRESDRDSVVELMTSSDAWLALSSLPRSYREAVWS